MTGEAKTGPYKGTKLDFFPSTVTSWQTWKELYPDTKVLPGPGDDGFMGTYRGFDDIDMFGLVITRFLHARLYPYEILEKKRVINDMFQDNPVVIFYHKKRGTATAWGRSVNGKILSFRVKTSSTEGFLIIDAETGSQWNPLTGTSTHGSYKGTELPAQASTPILIDRFKAHYPRSEVYKGIREK